MQLLQSLLDGLTSKAMGHVRLLLMQLLGSLAPYQFDTDMVPDPSYDFIVVGAGCAGSVVAARLSETNARVLLLEAGGSAGPETAIPGLQAAAIVGSNVDWNLKPVARDGIADGHVNRTNIYLMGRVMGGGTSINTMVNVRGSPLDYDNWANMGNTGWDFASVLPYFKKSEDFNGFRTPDTDVYHGRGGPLRIEKKRHNTRLMAVLLRAWRELGFGRPLTDSEHVQIGISPYHTTIRDGIRASSSESFLRPAVHRTNLHIRTDALVTKILFNRSNRAVGVAYIHEGKVRIVKVRKEVVVSGGSINTPKLLMLSGVGPAQHLRQMQVPVVAPVGGVGKNLKDHYGFYGLGFDVKQGIGQGVENPIKILQQYKRNRTGILADPLAIEAKTFLSLGGENRNWSDISISFSALSVGMDGGLFTRSLTGYKKGHYAAVFKPLFKRGDTITIAVVLNRPKSSGWVRLKSTNPLENPLVDFNTFGHPDDMRVFVKGIQYLFKSVLQTRAMRDEAEARFLSKPIPGCRHMEFLSDEYWACHARSLVMLGFHASGTCKMAPSSDPMGVVNARLSVRGVTGVRVVDASIMPQIVTANVMATTYMIGEKGADLIKQDWGYRTDPLV